jgi:hypothetical protein
MSPTVHVLSEFSVIVIGIEQVSGHEVFVTKSTNGCISFDVDEHAASAAQAINAKNSVPIRIRILPVRATAKPAAANGPTTGRTHIA